MAVDGGEYFGGDAVALDDPDGRPEGFGELSAHRFAARGGDPEGNGTATGEHISPVLGDPALDAESGGGLIEAEGADQIDSVDVEAGDVATCEFSGGMDSAHRMDSESVGPRAIVYRRASMPLGLGM